MNFNQMFDQHIFGYYKYDTLEAIPGIEDEHIVDEPDSVRRERQSRNKEAFRSELTKPNHFLSKVAKEGNWSGSMMTIPFKQP